MNKLISLFLLYLALTPAPAFAQALIRDAEIEHTLREYADPVFTAADLNPSAIRLFIVNSNTINAFVAGGANMFIHTGLIDATDSPTMLIGVIAHETGHIAGGHLARGSEKMRDAQIGMILSMVLGAAAGVAGGGDAGVAVMSGGQNATMRNLMAFSRANEQSADQAALGYLDKLNISASGMLEVFNVLRRNEMKQYGTPDPYMLTHPLSKDRIEIVRNHVEHSNIPEGKHPKRFDEMHQRMRAKLYAFLQMPPKTFARYPLGDRSVAARMARAIAWYKVPELNKALSEMDALLADYPKDAFFHELKGQILFENGKVKEALASYEKAVQLMPRSSLILSSLGEVQIATKDPLLVAKAVDTLNASIQLDNTNARTWRLLATAYGRQGNTGMSSLSLAEEALLSNNPEAAKSQAEQALSKIAEGTPARLRAEDVKRLAVDMKKEKEEQ